MLKRSNKPVLKPEGVLNPQRLRSFLLGLPRLPKLVLQVAADVALIWFSLWLAYVVRREHSGFTETFGENGWLFVLVPLIAVPLFAYFGLYRAVMRYVGTHALLAVLKAVTMSALVLVAVVIYPLPHVAVPRSLPVLYWCLCLLMVSNLRLLMRQFFRGDWLPSSENAEDQANENGSVCRSRVAIYGAGSAGHQLLTALRIGREMLPVAFMDDDPGLWGRLIDGLLVYPPDQIEQMIKESGARELLLAVPSASRARRRAILDAFERFPLHVRTVPGFMDLASGRVTVTDLQEVDISDLLGREPVIPDAALFERCLRNQVVMVTGAGGSIGSELCRQIVTSGPRVLILFEHSEFALYSIHSELVRWLQLADGATEILPVLGSVRNSGRLLDVMRTWGVNTVYHAAAYKHVPMVEHNIAEGFFNNTMGTLHSAQAAVLAGVENFVLISTDKAVRPTNVMGSTKRMAEMVLQALSRETTPNLFRLQHQEPLPNRTRFTMVRFGNVLGSSGSVIPLFREQIRRGGPVTVTHPEITRYFMTIPEAAQLVIQAGSLGAGGDVFVLDMGQPVKIVELAEKMIRLSGFSGRTADKPEGDIDIVFTGLRPGEKLYEELLIGDDVESTCHPMIMRAEEEYLSWDELTALLQDLIDAIKADDYLRIRMLLQQVVSGYRPDERIVDLIYTAKAT